MLRITLFFIMSIAFSVIQSQELSNAAMRNFKRHLINSTKMCTEKYNVGSVEILHMIGQDFLPPRETAKCYFLCMMQEFNLMDENGDFNEPKLENLMNYFPKSSKYTEKVENKLESCLSAAKSMISQRTRYSGCNRAYKLVKCMYDNKSTNQIQNKISGAGNKVSAMLPNVPTPEIPEIPSMPSLPSIPSMPSMPSMPSIPAMPSLPSMPSMPSIPPIPSLPSLPNIF